MQNFKKACKTTLLFLLAAGILSSAVMEIFFRSENYYYQDFRERAELAGTLDCVVLGASFGMRGFRPDLLDRNMGVHSYNLSGSRMTMQGRYEMLRVEASRNPIKTVILELSYDSMTRNRDTEGPEGDMYVIGRLGDFTKRVSYFLRAARPWDYGRLYYQYLKRGFNCIDLYLQGNFSMRNTKLDRGYAAFVKPDKRHRKNLKRVYRKSTLNEEFWSGNEKYLNKIIRFCQKKDIRLIMVTTPLSRVSVARHRNLNVFYDYYRKTAEENEVEFYDFNLLKDKDKRLPDDECFNDNEHLGNTGARKFTHIFAKLMAKRGEGGDISDRFYESYEEMYSHESYAQ